MDSPEKQFLLDRFYARYLCGNGALTDYRQVSRIQIAMANCGIGFYEPNAVNLSYAINHFIDGMNMFLQLGFSKSSICSVNHLLRNITDEKGYRDIDVWIGESKKKAKYIPPGHNELDEMMDNLIEILNKNKLTVKAIFEVYAQFLLIHPFLDGNGRTGRALIMVLLKKHKYPCCPPDLYRLKMTSKDFLQWVQESKLKSQNKIESKFLDEWLTWESAFRVLANNKINKAIKEVEHLLLLSPANVLQSNILELLWEQPVISFNYINKKLKVNVIDTTKALIFLIEKKVIEKKNVKNITDAVYISRPIIRLWRELDELLFLT